MAQLIHGTTIAGHIAIHAGNLADHSLATTTYVTTQINNLIAGAPGALNTLDELAAALGDDASFAVSVTNSLAGKLSLSGGTMTGQIYIPSAGTGIYEGALQIREQGYVGSNQSDWNYAPAITFHWGNRHVQRFGVRSDGLFAVDNEPLALRSWVTSQNYLTSLPSHNHDDRYYTESEIDSQIGNRLYQARVTIDVNSVSDTGLYRGSTSGWSNRPTIQHNGGALLHIDTHPGGYYSQLFFDTGADRLYLRNQSGGTWGSWLTMIHSGNISSQSVNYATTAGSLNSMNISQFTNNSGYLTSETIGTGNTSGVAGAKYQINDTWLRVNSDNRQFQIYGNSRSVIYRTDGVTNDHGGGGYPHIFYYGGSTDAERLVIFGTNGDIWMQYAGDWMSNLLGAKSNTGHTHDDRYYTESESDSRYVIKGSTQLPGSWPEATKFKSSGDIGTNTSGNHALQIFADDGNDAFMAFHISNDFATFFGLENSTNRLYTGGWSDGNAKYQLWDSRDFSSTNISNWNTAYGWGNHAGQGYITNTNSYYYVNAGAGRGVGFWNSGPETYGITMGTTSTYGSIYDNSEYYLVLSMMNGGGRGVMFRSDNGIYFQATGGGDIFTRGPIYPGYNNSSAGGQSSYYIYANTSNSGLRTNGAWLVNGNIYWGNQGVWLTDWLNQNVKTNANVRFSQLGLGGATADTQLSIAGTGHISDYLYLGGTAGTLNSWGTRTSGFSGYWRNSSRDVAFNNEGYGTTWVFEINGAGAVKLNRHIDANTVWGTAGETTIFMGWYGGKILLGNNNDGAHDWANAIGGNSVISTNKHHFYKGAYIRNNVDGAEVLAVDGVNGRLFTVTDSLVDSIYSVNTISGLPVFEVFANSTVTIGKYGNATTFNNDGTVTFQNEGIKIPYYNGGHMWFRTNTHWESVSGIDVIGGAGQFRISSDSGSIDLRVDGSYITGSGTTSSQWDTAYNKRPTAISFSGGSTKTLTLTQGDGSTLTAAFSDIDTDTNTDAQTLSLSGNTLSISGGNSVTLSSSGLSQATADGLYVRKNTWEGNSYIGTGGDIYGTIFYDSNDSAYYMNPNGRSNISELTANGKLHYFGTSGSWDGVGFSSLTSLHFQGHNQFWVGAGNAYWWNGGVSTEHDLLITTMQGYDSTSYYRGITFAVDINGNGSSGGYRLGRWQTYGTGWNTARLQVDASLSVGYGNRKQGGSYDEGQYPIDRGVWKHGRDVTGYGDDRVRSKLFSPTANGGGPWGSFASLEVSSILDGNNDIPALFRMHQWGSGAVEFWKPNGTTLYIRESPGGGGSWFTNLRIEGSTYITSSLQAYSYQGHSNVAGTGNASYHPSGIYSTGTNWLYGTMYLNNNTIYDIGTAYASGSFRAPIFYDSENTAFYADPSGGSKFRNLYVGDSGSSWSDPGGWGTQLHVSNGPHAIIRVYARNDGIETILYSHGTNQSKVGSGTNHDFTIVRNFVDRMTFYSGYTYAQGYLQAADSLRAPIFYDSNNTGYYLDPDGSSRLATINADYIRSYGNARVDNNLYLDQQYGSSIIGVYSSYRYQGVFSMGDSYKLAIDGSGVGNLYGMAWSHPNAGGVAGNLNSHGLLVMENGTFLAAISGSIRARDDVRAPALYDNGSRVAISRGEGRDYVNYSRYVYNNGAYSGTGWIEPSDLGVRYANSAGSVAWGNVSGRPTALSSFSNDLGNYGGWITSSGSISGSSGSTSAVNSTGWGNGNFTWYQTPGGLAPYTGSWASFLVSNHGDGSNYYNQTIIMPFWGPPQYSRREGGNNRGPYTFWSTENLDPNSLSGNLSVSGSITAGSDITAYSDIRLKSNIKTIENALDKTLALRGVSYNRNDSDDTKTKIGVIAQETLEVIPEVVSQDSNGMYSVAYSNMTALLIEAIKEQQAQIEELKTEVKKLRGE
jgi:hypothetical protein